VVPHREQGSMDRRGLRLDQRVLLPKLDRHWDYFWGISKFRIYSLQLDWQLPSVSDLNPQLNISDMTAFGGLDVDDNTLDSPWSGYKDLFNSFKYAGLKKRLVYSINSGHK